MCLGSDSFVSTSPGLQIPHSPKRVMIVDQVAASLHS